MFTGIIEEIGTVRTVHPGSQSASLVIEAKNVLEGLKNGDSINTNGVCLTVTHFDHQSFTVDAVPETMRRTNLGELKPGSKVNLERALQLNDRLGGHMVSGHIDGTGYITEISREDNALWYTLEAGPEIMRYIILKGSVALDGISLTVAGVSDKTLQVSIIPHTAAGTTLLDKKKGDQMNIENDLMAKYIEKFLTTGKQHKASAIDMNYLNKHGFIDEL